MKMEDLDTSNTEEVTLKDFQENVNYELFTKILDLAKQAREVYGEKCLSTFIYETGFAYFNRTFELQTRKSQLALMIQQEEFMKQLAELKTQEEAVVDKINFDELPKH